MADGYLTLLKKCIVDFYSSGTSKFGFVVIFLMLALGTESRFLVSDNVAESVSLHSLTRNATTLLVNCVSGHDCAYVRVHTGLGTRWVTEMKFIMNHAPGVGSIARPADQQSSELPLHHGCLQCPPATLSYHLNEVQ